LGKAEKEKEQSQKYHRVVREKHDAQQEQ
jgi:hypothetical protein